MMDTFSHSSSAGAKEAGMEELKVVLGEEASQVVVSRSRLTEKRGQMVLETRRKRRYRKACMNRRISYLEACREESLDVERGWSLIPGTEILVSFIERPTH